MYVNSFLLDGTHDTFAEKFSSVHTIVSPLYNSTTLENDLALLVLNSSTNFAPVKLPVPSKLTYIKPSSQLPKTFW